MLIFWTGQKAEKAGSLETVRQQPPVRNKAPTEAKSILSYYTNLRKHICHFYSNVNL